MRKQDDLLAFWGKAQPSAGQQVFSHPLLAHNLDVAAVALLLPKHRRPDLDPRCLAFLVALHDTGKISRSFQAMSAEGWPSHVLGPYPQTKYAGWKHDATGAWILSQARSTHLAALLPETTTGQRGWTAPQTKQLWRALAGHHGRPPEELHTLPSEIFCAACQKVSDQMLEVLFDLFRPPPLPMAPRDRDVARLAWSLAGLTTLADWIGSRQAWFPYVPQSDVADPARYFWGHALPHAASALAAAGLANAAPAPFTGLRNLFPVITNATPVQHWAETVAPPVGPLIAVIEDLTGSGKTEAALTLAHQLLAAGQAHGIYLALPTMATANAMYARLAVAYDRLFAPDTHPSLALAHGRATLNPRFASVLAGDGRNRPMRSDPADDPAEAHCAAWLGEDRRRALLADVGVGTLDQALLAILPVRHAALRLQGLAGKVLIVDEVHAYDHYMRQELATLLQFHAALGGSAILVSATLPRRLRQQLVSAFRKGLSAPAVDPVAEAYPLATLAAADTFTETPCAPRKGLPRTVTVERLPEPGEAVRRIMAAAEPGAAVAWIRNTVDDAIEGANLLRAAGLKPLLFHARFAMQDRLTIEADVLRRFGPAGTDRGAVLVATQVVEQSLDLDFDLIVTDLAPADLLIQRAGRLWRHDKRRQDRPLDGPSLLIIAPEPVDAPGEGWVRSVLPGTAAVYADHAMLWRSARQIFGRGCISTPADMRPVIEAVFDRERPDAVPAGLARADSQAYGKERSHAGLAAQNVLPFIGGYVRTSGLWEPDTHTPTRLEDRPHVTLRLARRREDGSIVPYADDPDPRRAWAASEVSVARHWIAECPLPDSLAAAALQARSAWGSWERDSPQVLLALLIPADDGYRLDGMRESGDAIVARYTRMEGLVMPRL